MEHVLFDVADGIATVTLNRPERRNALSIAASERLYALWDEIDAAPAIRVAIVTAADCGTFCAGMDLVEAARVRSEQGKDILEVLRDPFHDRMRAVRKPIVGALNGHFTAAGMVLAMHCDIRIGLAGTRAGIAEAKVGRGSPWAVPLLWMLPQAMLLEMLLTGDMQPVERLHQVGFVNHLEPDPASVRERATRIARSIASNAPLSVDAAKAGLRAGTALGAEAGLAASKELHKAVYASEDAQEGPRAFAEGRAPVWRGR
jgi:enoyl-CoA hydratase/carnithine racemase